MATVHSSRMGLVPQDPKPAYSESRHGRNRSPSPQYRRRRSPSLDRERRYRDNTPRERDRYDGRSGYRSDERERDGDPNRRRGRGRAQADDYFDDASSSGEQPRKKSRSPMQDRPRDPPKDERQPQERPRRASPDYNEYRRPSPPREREQSTAVQAPWRQVDSMYPNRRDRGPNGYGGGGDFLESRRQQRESMTVNIWPSSPKAPTRDRSPIPDSKRRKKSHKRRYDTDDSSDTDSEEERRRRRKDRKKSRKEKEKVRDTSREGERERRRHRSKSQRFSDDEGSGDDRERRRQKSRSKSKGYDRRSKERHRSTTRTKSPEQRPPTSNAEADEDEWMEKPTNPGSVATVVPPAQGNGSPSKVSLSSMPPPSGVGSTLQQTAELEDDSDDEVGPKPITSKSTSSRKVDERQYGGALLRGEGSAMAAFLKDGTDMRIPRRGEIGLASDEIASFESVGYVMSGSRHRRMNAVRMRKENQVISAEEKRGILKLQQEERERREAILREEFQQLVSEKLQSQGGAK